MASEAWTRDLAVLEAARRDWLIVRTSWTKFFGGRPFTYDLFGDAKAKPKVKGIDMLCVDSKFTFYGIQFTGDSDKPGGNFTNRVKWCRNNRKLMAFAARGLQVRVWHFRIEGSTPKLKEEVIRP